MPFRFGPLEIALILIIVLIVFGVGKLPQIGGAIGKSIREFKKGQHEPDQDKAQVARSEATKADTTTPSDSAKKS